MLFVKTHVNGINAFHLAMRECSNATTNSSPFTLLYGRLPRGPLAVLKETWSGERELPPCLNKSEVQDMQELKYNLEIAREYAIVSMRLLYKKSM